jgi:hypothetical protein
MKQIRSTTFSESVDGIRVFRDDIEDILSLLTIKSFNIEIHDSTAVYEDLDELITLKGNHVLSIEIKGDKKIGDWNREWVSIKFGKRDVLIFASGSEFMYAFGYELEGFFKSKIAWYNRIFNPWYFIIPPCLFSTLLIGNYDKYSKTAFYQFSMWLMASFIFLSIISLAIRYFNYGVTLTRRHEYGFWNRNKDKILLMIIATIFGSILTLIIQWMNKRN